jgi:hypothetical protein
VPRASRAGRRYQARLNFSDRMGEMWEWVNSLPEGSRMDQIWFHLQLGVRVGRNLQQAGAAMLTGGQVHVSETVTASPAAVTTPPVAANQSFALDDDWDPVALLGAEVG